MKILAAEAPPQSAARQIIDTGVLAYIAGYFLLYILVIGVSFYTHDYFYGVDKDDASSYLSDAFTIGLDGDLNYANEVGTTDMNSAGTARELHPMGSGILAAPFVAAFSVIDRRNNHPVLTDRLAYVGSWSYFGFQFATAFYFLAGIALYQLALRRWISPLIVAVAVLSSGLLSYVTHVFSFCHAYEFFTLALLTAGCVGLCNATERRHLVGLVMVVALATFLAIMVRWVDYGLWAIPLLVVLTHYLIERAGRYRQALLLGYAGMAAGAAMVVAFHLYAFGIVWPTPSYFYGESIDTFIQKKLQHGLVPSALRNLPNLPLLVFSSEFGLLYTFPLFPIAGLAALFMWVRNVVNEPLPWTVWVLAFGICVGVPLAVVLLWETTASGYGYRYLLSAMPALLLSTAVFLNSRKIETRYGRGGEWTTGAIGLVLGLAGFLAFVSIVSQAGLMKLAGFTLGPQINVFGVEHFASARGYMDAVFGALLNPGAWRTLYDESLFHQIVLPSLEIRENPQFVDQFRILLIVIPLIGAVLSATAYARDAKRFAATSALVVLVAALLWPLAGAIQTRERPLGTVVFGTTEPVGVLRAAAFIGHGFRREAPGLRVSWIIDSPATIHGVLPEAPAVKISANFYNPHPDQAITVLLNGRQVGRWKVDVGNNQPSVVARLDPNEAAQVGTIQLLVDRIETFEGSGNAALGVMMNSVTVAPAP
jgi:hypothetical protein